MARNGTQHRFLGHTRRPKRDTKKNSLFRKVPARTLASAGVPRRHFSYHCPPPPCPQVTGLEGRLMSLIKMLRDYIERGEGTIARLISSLAQTPAGQWLVSVGITGQS